MILYFVRHGETEYNKHHQLMGQRIDAPLDSQGLEQANQVIPKLPKDFAMIYCSPLKRALQTAQAIADFFNKNIAVSQDIRERDFGTLSGETWEQIDEETKLALSKEDANLTYDYTPYGGESALQVKDRLTRFIEELQSKHQNDTLVVVTHYGIISMMNSIHPNGENHSYTNSSIHKFEI